MARRVCLSIGVSNVAPARKGMTPFAYLDGAVVAARLLGRWAIHSGFGAANVSVVDDGFIDGREHPVTRMRVQEAVDFLFPVGAEPVEQLLLGFCGHGLTDSQVGSVSWLFSDSLLGKYRVVADMFYAELLLHGVERITLISDSCREAPKDIDLMRLDPVRGIVVQGAQVASPRFDRLDSCQDGQVSYMVSDPMSALPGKCVFSGVVADALWGLEASAINNGVITTAALGTCVRTRAFERARQYRLNLNPRCIVDPEPAVLYRTADPFPDPEDLQPWPPLPAIPNQPSIAFHEVDGMVDVGTRPARIKRMLSRVRSDAVFRERLLGSRLGDAHDHEHIDSASSGSFKIPDSSGAALIEIFELRQIQEPTPRVKRRIDLLLESVLGDVLSGDQESTAEIVRHRLAWAAERSGVLTHGRRADVVVWGSQVRVASRRPLEAMQPVDGVMRVTTGSEDLLLVGLDEDRWTPVVAYDSLFTAVVPGLDEDIFQAYGSSYSYQAYDAAILAIKHFASGRIGPHDVDRLAAKLRLAKHADPVLGAICAHLYRATADFDSIRRMAYFYAANGQPVPFDIALLGNMTVEQLDDGELSLQVPAVKARVGAFIGDAVDRLPDFVTQATGRVQAQIGGRCPWLGIGWDYVGEARREWSALVDGLAQYAGEVRRSGFTVMPNEVALELAAMWGLKLHS